MLADVSQFAGRTQHDGRTALPFLGRLDHSSYITIGLCSDVTLGMIEKVKIGNFAVAGAGSLVTRDIPDYEIHGKRRPGS